MGTPEDGSMWDEFLQGIDFSGLGDPDRFINRVHIPGRSTPEQNFIYDQIRGILSPHETYYHSQVRDFTSSPLPDGVRKDWRGRVRFAVRTNSGLHVPVVIQPQDREDKKIARAIQIDSNRISFDRQGRINEVLLGSPAHLPKTLALQQALASGHLRFFARNPGEMGVAHIGAGAIYKIGKDGLLTKPTYGYDILDKYRGHEHFRDLFLQLFKAAIEATSILRN